jgi:hypothetical protein
MKVKVTNKSIDSREACSIIHVIEDFRIFGSLLGNITPYVTLYPGKETVQICFCDKKYWGVIKK